MRKLTTEEFIAKARAIHGDRYDYSKAEYMGNKKQACIICPEHGDFWQTPDVHCKGHGCPLCANEATAIRLRKTLDKAILDFVKVHGDKYDYSEVEYSGAFKDVIIICPKHGRFLQSPTNHLAGHGCPKCSADDTKVRQNKSHLFLDRAKAVHGDLYDYSKVVYKSIIDPVVIICKKHGSFEQTPVNHLSGRGCPKCADRDFLSHEHGNLYIMVDDLEVPTIMKVGVSISPEERKNQVLKSAKKVGAVFSDLHVIKTWGGLTDDMQALEKAMHKALSQYKINFPVKFDGCQEFFYYRPEIFELVEEHLKKTTVEK